MKRWSLPLIALFFAAAGVRADAPKKLNLLIITADDMNADSPGFMGDRHAATPNLDAFAKPAHRFVNSHVTAPICHPSREALMTGRVPHRSGGPRLNPIRKDVPTLVAGT